MRALAIRFPGSQEVRAKGRQTLPTRSWIMNLPTRVPASTVVRMNNASNMMAKWYQKACSAVPPNDAGKVRAYPHGGRGAPAGPADDALLAHVLGRGGERLRVDREPEAA